MESSDFICAMLRSTLVSFKTRLHQHGARHDLFSFPLRLPIRPSPSLVACSALFPLPRFRGSGSACGGFGSHSLVKLLSRLSFSEKLPGRPVYLGFSGLFPCLSRSTFRSRASAACREIYSSPSKSQYLFSCFFRENIRIFFINIHYQHLM